MNNLLSAVFKNTVATYKFYWFIAILDLICQKGKTQMSVGEVISQMVAQAWYPIHYFKLSFGKSDSLAQEILFIQKETGLPIDMDKQEVADYLLDNIENSTLKSHLNIFSKNVPYRFLSPWIKYENDQQVISMSSSFHNDCPYALRKEKGELYIEINSSWLSYFKTNYLILKDYAYWNLTEFLQVRNPNVPDISGKLVKTIERTSLKAQHEFWNIVIHKEGPMHCIYTGKNLMVDEYDLDHFIPWSFVSHNQIWNLLPIDKSINCSKSNNLPDSHFIPIFAKCQKKAVTTMFKIDEHNKTLEDYQYIGASLRDMVEMDDEHFIDLYKKTISPLLQIAENMGFKKWNFK